MTLGESDNLLGMKLSGEEMRQHLMGLSATAPRARAAGRALSTSGSSAVSTDPSSAGSSFEDSGDTHKGFITLTLDIKLTLPLMGGFIKAMRRVRFDESPDHSGSYEAS